MKNIEKILEKLGHQRACQYLLFIEFFGYF
jgi:hypothetical protein